MLTRVSVAGNTVALSGDQALSCQGGPGGALRIKRRGNNVRNIAALRSAKLRLAPPVRSHPLETENNRVTARAFSTGGAVNSARNAFTASGAPFNTFPAPKRPAERLSPVARMIAARGILGARCFFVSMVG